MLLPRGVSQNRGAPQGNKGDVRFVRLSWTLRAPFSSSGYGGRVRVGTMQHHLDLFSRPRPGECRLYRLTFPSEKPFGIKHARKVELGARTARSSPRTQIPGGEAADNIQRSNKYRAADLQIGRCFLNGVEMEGESHSVANISCEPTCLMSHQIGNGTEKALPRNDSALY